jgi:hypothetical protein
VFCQVALDYNAPFTGLMAYQVMTSHDPPPYIVNSSGAVKTHHSAGSLPSGMPTWQLVLILVGTLVAVFALGILIFKRKRTQIQSWLALRKEKNNLKKSAAILHSLPGSKSSVDDHMVATDVVAAASENTVANLEKGTQGSLLPGQGQGQQQQQTQQSQLYSISTITSVAGLSSDSLTGSEPSTPMTGGPMSSCDGLLDASRLR